MKRIVKRILSVALMLLYMGTAKADVFESNGIYYFILSKEPEGIVKVVANPKGEPYSGENITIPSTVYYGGLACKVTSIDPYAFKNSTYSRVTISNSVTSIGQYAFQDCKNLTYVKISEGVTAIQPGTFEGCKSLTDVVMPDGIEQIGDKAFLNCSNLVYIYHYSKNVQNGIHLLGWPTSLKNVGFYSFSGCEFSDIPTSLYYIGDFAFSFCDNLTSVRIPATVSYIGKNPFQSCSGIESIVIDEDNLAYDSRNNCNAIVYTNYDRIISGCNNTTIPNDIKSIWERSFYQLDMSSITIGQDVTYIDAGAFGGCYELKRVRSLATTPPTCDTDAFGNINLSSITLYVPNVAKYKSTALWSEFGNILPLSEWKEYYTITYMVDGEVYATEEVAEGSAITPKIASAKDGFILYEWKGLPETMPSNHLTVEAVYTEPFTFESDGLWYSLCYKGQVAVVGNNGGRGGYDAGSITIPKTVSNEGVEYSVTSIGNQAFLGCSGLTSITIPSSVTSIGNHTFHNCEKLEYVRVLATTPPTCNVDAFLSTNKPTLFVPEESVKVYKSTSPWNSVFKVILPLKGWGEIFESDGLYYTPINEDKVAVIENQSGEKYSGIIVIPDTVSYKGKSYSVERIAEGAFAGCTNLTIITIPKTVTSIGLDAFKDCRKLTYARFFAVTPPIYDGTEDIFPYGYTYTISCYVPEESIELYRSHSSFSEVYIFSLDYWEKIFVLNGFYYSIISEDGVEMIRNLEEIDYSGDIIIPDTVCHKNKNYAIKSINGTFQNCKKLKSITIPNTVTTIGTAAFARCSSLTNVIIPNTVTTIGYSAFESCHSLIDIVLPNSVKSIESKAFNNCRNLVSVTLGDSISSLISVTTFANCDKLKRFICYAKHVPILGYSDNSSSFIDATLYVPEESIDAYKASKSWSKFAYILPIKEYKEYYTVTYMVDGVEYAIHELPEGPTIRPKDAPKAKEVGYIFMKWIGLPETMPNRNITVEAVYEPPFTFEKDGLYYLTIERDEAAVIANPNEGMYYSGEIVIPENVNHDDRNYTVKEISKDAFSGCSGLTSITIPKTVASIDKSSFSGCQNLASIYVESGNPVYDSREDCNAIIEIETNTLIRGCKNTVIPNTVAVIGERAFDNCIGLTSITIPDSVTNVKSSAFRNCSDLHTVIIADGEFSFALFVFQGCINLKTVYCYAKDAPKGWNVAIAGVSIEEATLYVPYSSVENYKTVNGWKRFGSILPITYKVTYMVDGEEYATDSVCYDEPITPIDVPVKDGYTFSGWDELPDTMPAHDFVVTGSFEVNGIESVTSSGKFVDVYTLQGVCIRTQIPVETLEQDLPQGIYIVDRKKFVVR